MRSGDAVVANPDIGEAPEEREVKHANRIPSSNCLKRMWKPLRFLIADATFAVPIGSQEQQLR
jgi:hypothetical protein